MHAHRKLVIMQIGNTIDFTLPDQDGNTVSLAQLRGKPVVLFFYPRADTPGCTMEACEFRDVYAQFKAAGATLLGISRDTPGKQKKFAEKFSLPYPLLADPELLVAKQFDVVRDATMYGKPVIKIERSTFVIDSNGKLQAEFRKINPEGHAQEILDYIHKS